VAGAAGVTVRTWARWESGERFPEAWRLPSIARALDVSLEALFAPDGYAVLPTIWLDESDLSCLAEGGQEARELAVALCTERIREAIAVIGPLGSARAGAGVRRRRTRTEVLHQAPRLEELGGRYADRRRAERLSRAIV
jgi:transcriptional regulator with XRE-family HTH domain